MIKSFSEYMNAKGKLVEKPTVDPKAEYKDSVPAKPDQGKGSAPYAAQGDADKYKVKPEKGFAEKGPEKLKYKPSTKVPAKVGEGGKKLASYPKVKSATPKSEDFLDATNGMTVSELAQFVSNQYEVSEKTAAHPVRYVKYMTSMMAENANVAASLIHETKRAGLLGLLVFEALQHVEGVATLVDMMADEITGPAFCRRLARQMGEEVSPPVTGAEDNKSDLSHIPTDPVGEEPAPATKTGPSEVNGDDSEEEEIEPHGHLPDPNDMEDESFSENETNASTHMIQALANHASTLKLLAEMVGKIKNGK